MFRVVCPLLARVSKGSSTTPKHLESDRSCGEEEIEVGGTQCLLPRTPTLVWHLEDDQPTPMGFHRTRTACLHIATHLR